MSQTAFLEDVVSWDERKCMEQQDEALPKLITCLQTAVAVEEEIGILKIICHSFIPCVEQHETERKVFSKILKKTCASFDKIVNGIKSGLHGKEQRCSADEITTSLEMAIEVVDCIESCIRNLIGRKQQLEFSHIHSLPECTVHLLSGSYIHCRDSATLYQELLGTLSEPLSALFRKAHSLQMAFLNLLDQTSVSGEASEQDVQDLCQVCTGLYEVSQIVTALDMKVVVSLWKALSKIASQNKELLYGHLDVCQMVKYLCGEIQSGYDYLFQLMPQLDEEGMVQSQGDEKAFVKSLKILGFQVKILVILVKDFRDFLGECEKELLTLMLNIYRSLPPSLCSQRLQLKYVDQIQSQIVVAIDPLLSSLLGNRHFRHCVTRKDSNFPDDLILPLLLLQLQILEMLPKVSDEEQDKWMNPTVYPEDPPLDNILQAGFSTAGRCFVELALPVYLPGVTVPGKQQRDVSLYDYTCTHLCGFMGSFPAKHFVVLEETLMANCLSQNPFQSNFAVDCWCFLARYGSADLCQQHIQLLLKMYQDVTASPHSDVAVGRLSSIIYRLVKFLAPQHQQNLMKDYPPSECLGLWSELPLHALTPNCARDVIDQLMKCCTKTLHNWIISSEKRIVHLKKMVLSLKCLDNIYHCPSLVEKNVTPQQQSVIVEKLCQLWKTFTTAIWEVNPVLEILFARMYQLSSRLVSYFNTEDVLQIFTVTEKLLDQPLSVFVRLEVVSFLRHCGSVKLGPSFEQSQVLHKLPEAFGQALKDPHCVVHHQALVSFTRFAEETVHESVVPECLEKDASLQDKVVAFLNKSPSIPAGGEQYPVEYLRGQYRLLSSAVTETSQPAPLNETTTYEPTSKRARTESNEGNQDSRCHTLLQRFQSVCSDIEDLLKSDKQQPWFVSDVRRSLTDLSLCLEQSCS